MVFPQNGDSKSKRMNLFKRFGDSVDIVQRKPGIAMQTGRTGSISTRYSPSATATVDFLQPRQAGRPSASIWFRARTATATSVVLRPSLRKRTLRRMLGRPSPITCLQAL